MLADETAMMSSTPAPRPRTAPRCAAVVWGSFCAGAALPPSVASVLARNRRLENEGMSSGAVELDVRQASGAHGDGDRAAAEIAGAEGGGGRDMLGLDDRVL
ncbi:MAG: hypothetical protein QOI93_913 [Rhodospirillaceae bacterium]|nr:hypothetical protein [Rhodospirillaceae bacterium]